MRLFLEISIFVLAVFALAGGVFAYIRSRRREQAVGERERQTDRRMYELAILKELGDRIGYSLNIQNIIDIITGSLHQFIEYSAVSYMLIEPEKVIFKVHLEKSVHQKFIDDIRGRMLGSVSALIGREFEKSEVEEVLSGAILIEELDEPVRSFFNIPLIIDDKVVGILTVADTKPGLYREEEMTILYKITNQASHAVTKLQEVVQTEQSKLNAMVESMTDGVVMTDKDYRVLVVNPAAKGVVKLAEDTTPSIFDFIDNLEGRFDIHGKLDESVKLDKILRTDEVLIHDRFYQIFVAPVKLGTGMRKGEILGGVVIFHDITQQKEVERLREDFTSMMVHELRAPLDDIKKMVEMISEGGVGENKELYEKYITMIHSSSGNMLELVNDLLDVAKLEAGKFDIRKEASDIKTIINDRIAFFEPSAKKANISVGAQFANNVPDTIPFDGQRITQVLNNLLSNALKFTSHGEGDTAHNESIAIQAFLHESGESFKNEAEAVGLEWKFPVDNAKTKQLGNSLVVAVTDSGQGIKKANQEQLFNKFKQFRETATSGEHRGTGLGLAIVKGIVEAHGGVVGVASEPGVGATFYFTIPLAVTTTNSE